MRISAPFHILRPFLWLAPIAFLVGFVGCLALGGDATAYAKVQPPSASAVSAPASEDWNFPKRI
jgi:hypothetical protein